MLLVVFHMILQVDNRSRKIGKSAFSLVELSIVLVILGLLVGGILSGQSLIRASEMRSVISDSQRYITAMGTFRDKYFALPGDMANAISFWGAAHATPATCRTTSSTSAATCDGNGDGQIGTVDGGTTVSERFRFWQHMANAGLIEGTYTGVAGGGGGTPVEQPVIGTNVPRSKIAKAGYYVTYFNTPVTTVDFFGDSVGNFLFFGADNNNSTGAPVIKAEEAWNIDSKLDDGRPGYGKIISYPTSNASVPNCSTTASASTAVYNLSNAGTVCTFLIKTGY
ncbi:MAG: prepilin-type N-terminal cleavage/methylation domain-containing protein [Pseudomonadota bacterium]